MLGDVALSPRSPRITAETVPQLFFSTKGIKEFSSLQSQQIERFINFESIQSYMGGTNDLETLLTKEEFRRLIGSDDYSKIEAVFNAFQARYAPNGKLERIGPSDDCLKIEAFGASADNRISKRKKERYNTHIQACEGCREFYQGYQSYLAQRRSQNRVAVLFREAVALPYRFMDYISEKVPELKQRIESLWTYLKQ